MNLSPHFDLSEFTSLPELGVPTGVLENLGKLATTLLEPAREALGRPIVVTSGYRTQADQERLRKLGYKPAANSDHLYGRAADVIATASTTETWEESTFTLFHWLRTHKLKEIGQLILEDHRAARKKSGSLWVHVAITSGRHQGLGAGDQLLVSFTPGAYQKWSDSIGGFA